MKNEAININHLILLPVKETAKAFNVSEWWIRQGLKAGTIPHIRCGRRILINVPMLMAQMDEQSSHSLVKL